VRITDVYVIIIVSFGSVLPYYYNVDINWCMELNRKLLLGLLRIMEGS